MPTCFVYAHGRDPDGICSAAILKRHLGAGGEIDFIDYDPVSELEDTFDEMKRLPPGSRIVLVDFGVDESSGDLVKSTVGQLKENGCSIEWLDHHKWEESMLKEIGEYAEMDVAKSTEACGAELAYKKYMNGDNVSEALAKVGRDSDIDAWKCKPPTPAYALTFPLADLIIYYNYRAGNDRRLRKGLLNKLVDKLAVASEENLLNSDFEKPPFLWDAEMEMDWKDYKKLQEEKFEACSRSAEVLDAGKYRYVLGRPDDLLSTSMSSSHLLEKFGKADFSIVIYGDGKMSMRRRNPEIKCNEIAKLFGGAGHEYAAGGRMGFSIKGDEDYSKAKSIIAERVANLYSA